jgi:ABC-2 type transport system permease protein
MGSGNGLRVFKTSFAASFKETMRYFTLKGEMISSLTMPAFFLLTSWIINVVMISAPGANAQQYFQGITGMSSYLTFSVIGTAFFGFIGSAVFGSGGALRGEQEHGTLELVYLTPANKLVWMSAKTLSNMHTSVIQAAVLIILGQVLFGLTLSPNPDLLLALVALLLTVLGHMSFGFLYAGLVMFVRNADAVGEALWPLMLFLSGITFPVEILPGPVRFVAELLPLTHGLRIFRGATMLGWTFGDAWVEILVLSVITVVMLPLGYIVLRRIEKKARQRGTLSTY